MKGYEHRLNSLHNVPSFERKNVRKVRDIGRPIEEITSVIRL